MDKPDEMPSAENDDGAFAISDDVGGGRSLHTDIDAAATSSADALLTMSALADGNAEGETNLTVSFCVGGGTLSPARAAARQH